MLGLGLGIGKKSKALPDSFAKFGQPVAAFSLRKLTSLATYSIRARRESDNSEKDIGFKNGLLDEDSLEEFGGASDCFVTTWYDQSGNGNDATQTTQSSQPKIYDLATASVIKENSKSAMEFDGVNDFIRIPNIAGTATMDIFFVNRHDPTIGLATEYLYPYSNSEADKFGFVAQDGSNLASIVNYGSPSLYKNETLVSPSNTRGLVYSSLGQSQNLVMHQRANISSWTDFSIGNHFNKNFSFGGTFQEIAIFDKALTSGEREQVQDDINSFYNIY